MDRESRAWVTVLLAAFLTLVAGAWLVLGRRGPASGEHVHVPAMAVPPAPQAQAGTRDSPPSSRPERRLPEPSTGADRQDNSPAPHSLFLEGEILDGESLSPIGGASVVVGDAKGTFTADGDPSDAMGRFRVRVPGSSLLHVRVSCPGYAPWEAFPVRAGDSVTALLGRSGEVAVRVLGSSGAPLPGATVQLLPQAPTDDARPEGALEASTTERGLASLREVPPGRYFLTVLHPEHRPYRHDGLVRVPSATADPIVVSLQPWFRLAGTVRDAATERGIEGARIFAGGALNTTATTSDAEGRFVLPEGVDGLSFLHVSADRHAERWIDVLQEVLPAARIIEGVVHLEVRLRREVATVHGRVVSPDGRGISGAVLRLSRSMPPRVAGAVTSDLEAFRVGGRGQEEPWSWREAGGTDAEGRFVLANLEPNRDYECVLRGIPGDWRAFRAFRTPGPGEELDLGSIVPRPDAWIFGRVRDAHGQPLAGIHVLLAPEFPAVSEEEWASWQARMPSTVRQIHTGPTGWFLLRGIWPGTYTIQASQSPPVHLVLQPGEHKGPLRLRLHADELPQGQGDWTVAVTDLSGAPLPGIRVVGTIPNRPDRILAATTDREGRVTFSSAPGERARLSLLDPQGRFRSKAVEAADPTSLPSRTLEIRLAAETAAPLAVEGTVIDPRGQPLAGIRLEFWPAAVEDVGGFGRSLAFTDAGGAFHFPAADEDYWLQVVDVTGRYASRLEGPLRPGGGPLEIRLEEGTR